jgi:hypothetical protein
MEVIYREVAEFVSGLRGQDVSVYELDTVAGGLDPVLTPEPVPGGTLRFDAYAALVRTGRPRVTVRFKLT